MPRRIYNETTESHHDWCLAVQSSGKRFDSVSTHLERTLSWFWAAGRVSIFPTRFYRVSLLLRSITIRRARQKMWIMHLRLPKAIFKQCHSIQMISRPDGRHLLRCLASVKIALRQQRRRPFEKALHRLTDCRLRQKGSCEGKGCLDGRGCSHHGTRRRCIRKLWNCFPKPCSGGKRSTPRCPVPSGRQYNGDRGFSCSGRSRHHCPPRQHPKGIGLTCVMKQHFQKATYSVHGAAL